MEGYSNTTSSWDCRTKQARKALSQRRLRYSEFSVLRPVLQSLPYDIRSEILKACYSSETNAQDQELPALTEALNALSPSNLRATNASNTAVQPMEFAHLALAQLSSMAKLCHSMSDRCTTTKAENLWDADKEWRRFSSTGEAHQCMMTELNRLRKGFATEKTRESRRANKFATEVAGVMIIFQKKRTENPLAFEKFR